jgi:hypothetical protein
MGHDFSVALKPEFSVALKLTSLTKKICRPLLPSLACAGRKRLLVHTGDEEPMTTKKMGTKPALEKGGLLE